MRRPVADQTSRHTPWPGHYPARLAPPQFPYVPVMAVIRPRNNLLAPMRRISSSCSLRCSWPAALLAARRARRRLLVVTGASMHDRRVTGAASSSATSPRATLTILNYRLATTRSSAQISGDVLEVAAGSTTQYSGSDIRFLAPGTAVTRSARRRRNRHLRRRERRGECHRGRHGRRRDAGDERRQACWRSAHLDDTSSSGLARRRTPCRPQGV